MEELRSLLQRVQHVDPIIRTTAEANLQLHLSQSTSVVQLFHLSIDRSIDKNLRKLALVFLVRRIGTVWAALNQDSHQLILEGCFGLLFEDENIIRSSSVILLSKVYVSASASIHDFILTSLSSMLELTQPQNSITALRCFCTIVDETDAGGTLDLLTCYYQRLQQLISSVSTEAETAQSELSRHLAKLMRLSVHKFANSRVIGGLDEACISSINAFISSWSSLALFWIENYCQNIEIVQSNLGTVLELFKFLEISLEAFPENTTNSSLRAVLVGLNVLVLIKDRDLKQKFSAATLQQSGLLLQSGEGVFGLSGYSSDGDRIDFEVLVIQIFEILSLALFYVSGSESTALLVGNIEQIIQIMFHYMQLNNVQQENWLSDPNTFIAEDQEDTFEFSIRHSGSQLIRRICKIAREHAFVAFFTAAKLQTFQFFENYFTNTATVPSPKSQSSPFQQQQQKNQQQYEPMNVAASGFVVATASSESETSSKCGASNTTTTTAVSVSIPDSAVVWLEGVLWSLMFVCKRYMKEWAMEQRRYTGSCGISSSSWVDITSSTVNGGGENNSSHSSNGYIDDSNVPNFVASTSAAAAATDRSPGSRESKVFAAVAPQTLASFISYACVSLINHPLSPPMLRGRALSLYCITIRITEPTLTVQMLFKATEFMRKEHPLALRLQACRAIGRIIYKLSKTHSHLEGKINSLNMYTENSPMNLSCTIAEQIIAATVSLSSDSGESTIHFLIEALVEVLKCLSNSVSHESGCLVAQFACSIWETFARDALVVELVMDMMLRLLGLPSFRGYAAMQRVVLPFIANMIASVDSLGGKSPSRKQSLPSVLFECVFRLAAKVGTLLPSAEGVSCVVVCKAQVLSLIDLSLATPCLLPYHKDCLAAFNIMMSSCYRYSESITSIISADALTKLNKTTAAAVYESLRRVESDPDDQVELITPTVGSLCHLLLQNGACSELEVLQLLGKSMYVVKFSSSLHVRFYVLMGFVHLFARNANEIIRLISSIVQQDTILEGFLQQLIQLWLQLHMQLGSQYNCAVSSIGLLRLIAVLKTNKSYHELACSALQSLLEKLPDVTAPVLNLDGSLADGGSGIDGGISGGDDWEDDVETKYEASYDAEEATDTGFDSDFADEWSNADVEGDVVVNATVDEGSSNSSNARGVDLQETMGLLKDAASTPGAAPRSCADDFNGSNYNITIFAPAENYYDYGRRSNAAGDIDGGDSAAAAYSAGACACEEGITLVNISDRLVFSPPSADPLANADVQKEVRSFLLELQDTEGGSFPYWMNCLSNSEQEQIDTLLHTT